MKRIFICVLCLCLLAVSPALAATLGEANVGYGGGGYICSFTAPNGQTLYYVSAMTQEDMAHLSGTADDPIVETVDANFDGTDDLVITTVVGASNAFQIIYLNIDGQYVLATQDACYQTDLPNVWFDAERQLVVAQGSNGWAGMLHDAYVFRWEDTRLRLVRRAISAVRETIVQEGGRILSYEDDGMVHGTVFGYDDDGSETVLWQGEVDAMNAGDAALNAYQAAENDALFAGL